MNTARQQIAKASQALALLIPWALLAMAINAVAVWILFELMQMRGMVM